MDEEVTELIIANFLRIVIKGPDITIICNAYSIHYFLGPKQDHYIKV